MSAISPTIQRQYYSATVLSSPHFSEADHYFGGSTEIAAKLPEHFLTPAITNASLPAFINRTYSASNCNL